MSDLITTREACQILGYADPSSVSVMVKQGRLVPAQKLPGKRGAFLFRRTDVESLAQERAA